ncbi:MAG: hypothetical protein JWM19_4262 [Actinomycetia bacterium]|nr:hypothetical protein [Actinomycetes bacterium]
MTCAELHDEAAELALGVLTGRERAAAVAHLEKCEAFREEVRQLMATGEQLLKLLPPAEPPAGFETRALERLGMPAAQEGQTQPRQLASREHRPRHRGRSRRGPVCRALAATVMGVGVIAAGLGGWRIGVGTSPSTSPAAAPLTSASMLSVTHSSVGSIFLYAGTPRWLYMYVDIGTGNEPVTCQVVGADGKASTIGSFRLADGYGAWGSPDPGNIGTLTGARLVSANGTILATASFAHR